MTENNDIEQRKANIFVSIKGKYLQVQNKTALDSFNSSIIKT